MDEGDGAQSEELEDEGSAEEEWFRCPPQTTGSKQSEPCLQDGENVEESFLFESSEKKKIRRDLTPSLTSLRESEF